MQLESSRMLRPSETRIIPGLGFQDAFGFANVRRLMAYGNPCKTSSHVGRQ